MLSHEPSPQTKGPPPALAQLFALLSKMFLVAVNDFVQTSFPFSQDSNGRDKLILLSKVVERSIDVFAGGTDLCIDVFEQGTDLCSLIFVWSDNTLVHSRDLQKKNL